MKNEWKTKGNSEAKNLLCFCKAEISFVQGKYKIEKMMKFVEKKKWKINESTIECREKCFYNIKSNHATPKQWIVFVQDSSSNCYQCAASDPFDIGERCYKFTQRVQMGLQ